METKALGRRTTYCHVQQNGWIFMNEHEERRPVTEPFYHLYYVKVKVRQHSSAVKEIRTTVKFYLAQERAVSREQCRAKVWRRWILLNQRVEGKSWGIRIFYLDLYVGYLFTYWHIHWFVDISDLFMFLFATFASIKIERKMQKIKCPNLYCDGSSQHQSPEKRLIVWYDLTKFSSYQQFRVSVI